MAGELPPEQAANVIIAVIGAVAGIVGAVIAGIFAARKRDPEEEKSFAPRPYHVALDERSHDAMKDLSRSIRDAADTIGRATGDHADEVKEHRRDINELTRVLNRKGNDT